MNYEYYRILIKDHYDKPSDLVCRRLNRAVRKINVDFQNIINDDGMYLYAYKLNNHYYEFFTGEEIVSDKLEKVDDNIVDEMLLSLKKSMGYHKMFFLIANLLFNGSYHMDFVEISTMEEASNDRHQLFNEYNNNLTDINPYNDEYIDSYDDVKGLQKTINKY